MNKEYNTIKLETLFSVLNSHKNITNVSEGASFRHILFTINGFDYHIEWFINQCYLHYNMLTVCFNNVKLSGTWPNKAKQNLQFYDAEGNPVAIIPVEEYSE